MKLLIMVPAYNEALNIQQVVSIFKASAGIRLP